MQKLLYTGTNYDDVTYLCSDRVLTPYCCIGFSILSVDTGESLISVKEGDFIVRKEDSSLQIE